MSERDRGELIAEALIGDEAKKFKESDLGKCLTGMALQESQLAMEALATVNPTDVQAIERLQNRVALGKQFPAFIDELIERGNQALLEWKQSHETQN